MNPCTFGQCVKPVKAHGLCAAHDRRRRLYGDPAKTAIASPSASAGERLARFTPPAPTNACWEWTGHRDKDGYGSIRFGGRRFKAHALSYQVAAGAVVQSGFVVRHRCDNPPCVNPRHLIPGTHAQNAADRVERGRSRSLAGEANPTSKLTAAAVHEIRQRLASKESHSSIAALYGVSRKAISKIANNLTWKAVA